MAVFKHEIPILEHDTNPTALLRNDRNPEILLPRRCVFAFLGDIVDDYAASHKADVLDIFHTISMDTPIYRIRYQGEDLCLCRAPLGGAAAVQLMDWLIGHGVTSIIASGSCGTLVDIPENAFLIPKRALRDEGTSYHYLAPSRYIEISQEIRDTIKAVLTDKGLRYTECLTWTTDGFFRETEAMVAYRREEGCAAVEMECASLAACAQFRGIKFGQFLYTADSLADAKNYDERDWGKSSLEIALALCLDIALRLP